MRLRTIRQLQPGARVRRHGPAEGGGSGWVILTYSPRDKRLVNAWRLIIRRQFAAGQPVLVSYVTSTRITWISAQRRRLRRAYMQIIRWDNAAKLYERYSARHDHRRGGHCLTAMGAAAANRVR